MGISNQLPMIIAESLVPNQTVVAAPFPLREETRCLTLACVAPTGPASAITSRSGLRTGRGNTAGGRGVLRIGGGTV